MSFQPKKPLSVLLVEDSPDDVKLILRELDTGGFAVAHACVTTAVEMRAALSPGRWDIILCDYMLPRFSGAAALQLVRELNYDAPFIFVSGTIGEETAVTAMRSGAHDYVMKDNLARLAPAVERELRDAATRREVRLADAAMRNSEHKYRHLFESLSDAAFLYLQASGLIVDTNRQAETLTGRERQELLGSNYLDCYTPEFRGEWLSGMDSVRANGEADVLRKDGTRVPVHISVTRIQLHDRALMLALVRDISDKRRAEAAVRESELLYRSLVTGMAEGMVFQDAQGRVTAVNPAAEKIQGKSAAMMMMGQTLENGLSGAIREDGTQFPLDEHPSMVTLRTGISQAEVIMGIRRPSGELRWISVNSQPLVADSGSLPFAVITTFHDITDQRQSEIALRASEERFSRVFKLSPTAICVVRASDGQFADVNDAFVRATGYTREEIVGRTTLELKLWSNPDERSDLIQTLHGEGSVRVHKIQGRKKNGDRVVGLGATSTIMLNGEKHVLSLIHDITELEHAEEALRESERRFRQVTENIDEVFGSPTPRRNR